MLLLATQFVADNAWLIDVRPKTVSDAVFECLVQKGHVRDAAATLPSVPYEEIVGCIETALA